MAARRQNPKIERTLKRASSLRTVKQTFLIVCEGEVTEPEYFNSFRLTSANVKAIGKGMNTISLVKEAIAIRDIEKRRNRNYDQCWVVFDKDDFTDSDFNAAIQMAQANGFHVAYSNWKSRAYLTYIVLAQQRLCFLSYKEIKYGVITTSLREFGLADTPASHQHRHPCFARLCCKTSPSTCCSFSLS